MMLDVSFLQNALPYATIIAAPGVHTAYAPVAIDSRMVQAGDFFIALRGARHDGNAFVATAFAQGACGALIHQDALTTVVGDGSTPVSGKIIVAVPDTLTALIDLAKAWRAHTKIPVVGITGSVGKTSTKEMVRSILQHAGIDVFASYKNYNTVIGLCYNMLRVPPTAGVAVFEMGINDIGEMDQLVDIARPTIAVITCVAHAHVQGLGGSLAGIAAQKRRIFKHFSADQIGIVCGDQPLLADLAYPHPLVKFGLKTKNNVQARKITVVQGQDGKLYTHFVLKAYGQRLDAVLPGNHQGMVTNALAACTVAHFLGVKLVTAVQALAGYAGVEKRFEEKRLKHGVGRLFSDCYNANPESMKAAIVAFDQLVGDGDKIAVIGDMLELGEREVYWHRQVGRILAKTKSITTLVLVGQRVQHMAKVIPHYFHVTWAPDWQEAAVQLSSLINQKNCLVLVKSSRGVMLDRMVDQVAQ